MLPAEQRILFARFLVLTLGIMICAVALEILLAPAPGQPPEIEKALEDFSARYSNAAVNEIHVSRDEIMSRTFEIDYRDRISGKLGRLHVHYVRRGDGKWEIDPEPPKQLP